MTNEKLGNDLDFNVEMKLTDPLGKKTPNVILVSYGAAGKTTDYANDGPDSGNKIGIHLPIKGSVYFGDDARIDPILWPGFDTKAAAELTVLGGDTITYKNTGGIHLAPVSANKTLDFSFDAPWNVSTDAAPFADTTLSLLCQFALPLEVEGVGITQTFYITGSGCAGTEYYTSKKSDTVFIPLIQVYSEQAVYGVDFSVTAPRSLHAHNPFTAVYGAPARDPAAPDLYIKDNHSTGENKAAIQLPLSGVIQFDKDSTVDITTVEQKSTLELSNKDKIVRTSPMPLAQSDSNHRVEFSIPPAWGNECAAAALNAGPAALECSFTLPVTRGGTVMDKTFTIKSKEDPGASYYVSKTEAVAIPMVQIYAEDLGYRPGCTCGIITPAPKKGETSCTVVLGRSLKAPEAVDYNYRSVVVDSDNTIPVCVPLSGIITFPNTSFPKAAITGAADLALTLSGGGRAISYNGTLDKWYTIDKGAFTFNLSPDWNVRESAGLLNSVPHWKLSASFTLKLALTLSDGGTTTMDFPVELGGSGPSNGIGAPLPPLAFLAETYADVLDSCISDLGIYSKAACPAGYTRLPVVLVPAANNTDPLYLCYQRNLKDSSLVTGLKLWYGKENPPAITGFSKIDTAIPIAKNKNAYLYYSKDSDTVPIQNIDIVQLKKVKDNRGIYNIHDQTVIPTPISGDTSITENGETITVNSFLCFNCHRSYPITSITFYDDSKFDFDYSPYSGYERVNIDLNFKADGKYIYLLYRRKKITGENKKEMITGLTITSGKAPDGFTRIDTDLNHGRSGSNSLYLCYKKYKEDKNNDPLPVKQIDGIFGSFDAIMPPAGWTRINKDLNAKVGGDFIFLCYKK